MQLLDYLRMTGVTLKGFGQTIKRTEGTVSKIARGKQLPDWTTISAIEIATNGAVSAADWLAMHRSLSTSEPKQPRSDHGAIPETE